MNNAERQEAILTQLKSHIVDCYRKCMRELVMAGIDPTPLCISASYAGTELCAAKSVPDIGQPATMEMAPAPNPGLTPAELYRVSVMDTDSEAELVDSNPTMQPKKERGN